MGYNLVNLNLHLKKHSGKTHLQALRFQHHIFFLISSPMFQKLFIFLQQKFCCYSDFQYLFFKNLSQTNLFYILQKKPKSVKGRKVQILEVESLEDPKFLKVDFVSIKSLLQYSLSFNFMLCFRFEDVAQTCRRRTFQVMIISMLKELRNHNGKLFLCPPKK